MDVRSIPLEELLPPLYPVRRVADDEKMAELARSIQVNGLLHPLVVIPEDGNYRILAGHRRFIAVSGLRWEEVPCNVIGAQRQLARMVSIEENLVREGVNPVDLGWYFRHLCENEHMTQVEIGQLLGKSQPWVSQFIRLTTMDDHRQAAVQEGFLDAQSALLIESIDNVAIRESLTRDAISRGTSYHRVRAAKQQYERNKDNIDRAIEIAQAVREEQATETNPLRCLWCGERALDAPGEMVWLCGGCIRELLKARDTDGQG